MFRRLQCVAFIALFLTAFAPAADRGDDFTHEQAKEQLQKWVNRIVPQ